MLPDGQEQVLLFEQTSPLVQSLFEQQLPVTHALLQSIIPLGHEQELLVQS